MPLTPEQEALKQAAMAATPGPWLHRHDPGNPVGVQHGVKLAGEFGAWVCDCLDNADQRKEGGVAGDRNAQFIASANPSAILAILAQLEAAKGVTSTAPEFGQEHVETRMDASFAPDVSLAAIRQPVHAVPDVLFAGHAVYEEITRILGREHCISMVAVSATLDAAVRLIRAAPGDPAQ